MEMKSFHKILPLKCNPLICRVFVLRMLFPFTLKKNINIIIYYTFILKIAHYFIYFQFEELADRDDLMGVEDTAKRNILLQCIVLKHKYFVLLF